MSWRSTHLITEGQSVVDLEHHLSSLANRTWRVRHHDGEEKIALLPDNSPLLASTHTSWQQVPEHARLEYRIGMEA